MGMGVVPMGELTRMFVDHAGWMNQKIAALADSVTFVVAGLPQRLKGE
ncbi:adenosylcobinamide kinase/adenosylcobinamide-phosphate guanylyltransferase [Vibrio cholerae]|uniref:Adenosylcobinamide kinase n=1 Tax=Vibrio cholerae TaxID=666 RepID=A0A655YY65_VIBCL|nr:adenosylcobinamide kinase/adenosylcobinamide-phosphate guanylyltransferase [Vibrio cholerae]CSC55244.1 adenosylcobinamide kinase/adenosylcobinamide-phosphate guanylyltransferase [Vibrio cholerae]